MLPVGAPGRGESRCLFQIGKLAQVGAVGKTAEDLLVALLIGGREHQAAGNLGGRALRAVVPAAAKQGAPCGGHQHTHQERNNTFCSHD